MINSGNIAITVRQSDVAIELPNGDIVLISHHDWLHVASNIEKATPTAYVRSIRARLDLAATAELRNITDDITAFLASPGAQYLTDPQRRNLQRMRNIAQTRLENER